MMRRLRTGARTEVGRPGVLPPQLIRRFRFSYTVIGPAGACMDDQVPAAANDVAAITTTPKVIMSGSSGA
jgi:hypothetical protein